MSRHAGAEAEKAVEHCLAARGLKLVARNFRCRYGEIDLVMDDRGTLAIIEVRSRRAGSLCSAGESVSRLKQKKIVLTARYLLATMPDLAFRPVRFDVVAISRSDGENAVEWIRDAFRP